MSLFSELLRDEYGFVLSAESMLLGTVGVIGATVGLSAASSAVNDELTEVALAIRSIDQSFSIAGDSRCGACVAGSQYTQPPVEESLKQLRTEIETAKAAEQKLLEERQNAEKNASEAKPAGPESPDPKARGEKRRKARKQRERDRAVEQDAPLRDDEPKDGDKTPTSV